MRNTTLAVTFLALATAGLSSQTMAADLPVYVDEVAVAAATSNWDGVYLGVGIGYTASINVPANGFAHAKVILGANATWDSFLLGAEAYLGVEEQVAPAVTPPAYAIGGAEVRAGWIVSDAAVIYVAGGFEADSLVNGLYATAGAGVEFLVTDDLSLDLEYKYLHQTNGAFRGHQIGASLNWHFN